MAKEKKLKRIFHDHFNTLLLLSDAEDGISTTMTEEITQLQNVVAVVGQIVDVEQARAKMHTTSSIGEQTQPIPIIRLTGQSLEEVRSENGDEDLPAYEHNDSSHMSSVVADGFQYTPGSDYTPSQSSSGSLSDILGPDRKQ